MQYPVVHLMELGHTTQSASEKPYIWHLFLHWKHPIFNDLDQNKVSSRHVYP